MRLEGWTLRWAKQDFRAKSRAIAFRLKAGTRLRWGKGSVILSNVTDGDNAS
jgi:hypothetical protein